MSKGINKVILIGNVGGDPEVRYTQNGTATANFSIATSDSWKNKQGQKEERTEWHRVIVYGSTAEFADKYIKKGAKVYIEGSLRTNKWTDKNNVERQVTEVVGNSLQSLDSNNKQQQHAHQENANSFEDVPF